MIFQQEDTNGINDSNGYRGDARAEIAAGDANVARIGFGKLPAGTYSPSTPFLHLRLDFDKPADELSRLVRAFNPWPGTYTILDGKMLKIHSAHRTTDPGTDSGKLEVIDKYPAIGTSNGWLVLDEVQPAGKKSMIGEVFLHGSRQWDGFVTDFSDE